MSLKKALNKLKPGHSHHGSDDEGLGGHSTPGGDSPTVNGGTGSPRSSFTFHRRDSPSRDNTARNSIDSPARHSLTGLDNHHRRTHSPGIRSPVRAVKDKLHIGSPDDSSSDGDTPLNREGEPMSKNQLRKHDRKASQEERRMANEKREEEIRRRREEADLKAQEEEPPEVRARYGEFPVNNYAGEWKQIPRTQLLEISSKDVGKEIVFRARVHNIRKMSSKLVFFLLRQQVTTIQGVLQEHAAVSSHMVYWAEHIDVESVVLVKGIVQEPKAKQGEIIGATIHDAEISIHELHLEAKVTEPLPFTVNEAEVPKKSEEDEKDGRIHVSERARIQNRIIDLRTTTSQAIFRVQAGLCHLFREYLDTQGFIEIHTPKLQGGATESGASVFKLDYFGRPAFLAQSPQLAKQMSIAADFRRVYEIGPVFRAENSNTHRHLTEFTGLDLEMAIDEHYHEVLRTLDNTFKHIFKGIYARYRTEIELIKKHFPHEDLVWLEKTPVLKFREAIRMLNASGWRDEDGKELSETEDMGTRDEMAMGRLIKEKFGTDFYVIDKFPASARPFYAMPDPTDPEVTNSFDIFLRGQEILSGGQRIHDADTLLKTMERQKIDPTVMEDYVQGFQWAAPPHGGGGIGMERILMLLLNLGDIRHASMYPRDPKSMPARPVIKQLRHPEASTLHPPWSGQDRNIGTLKPEDYQPLEKLIANYGDATNTSWLEPRTRIWREPYTGAAVGYVPQDGFAITVGDPLCHTSQYVKVMTGYLKFIKKETNLKPLWLLVGHDVEEVLATRFNWRTFSVAAEQRMNLENNHAAQDHDLQRKIRRAEKEGIKITDFLIENPVPEEWQRRVDERVQDWINNRKGDRSKQVHLTEIRPWQDMAHRQYHIAENKEGKIEAIVVMAQLSPDHGWQVKYALDFPGATNGTIEYAITHALKKVAATGDTNVTFGGGASSSFTPGHNLKGTRVKILAKAYHAIATELKLTNKSEFREKLGTTDDPIYVCYPPHGLGPMGVKAIMAFFEDE